MNYATDRTNCPAIELIMLFLFYLFIILFIYGLFNDVTHN